MLDIAVAAALGAIVGFVVAWWWQSNWPVVPVGEVVMAVQLALNQQVSYLVRIKDESGRPASVQTPLWEVTGPVTVTSANPPVANAQGEYTGTVRSSHDGGHGINCVYRAMRIWARASSRLDRDRCHRGGGLDGGGRGRARGGRAHGCDGRDPTGGETQAGTRTCPT